MHTVRRRPDQMSRRTFQQQAHACGVLTLGSYVFLTVLSYSSVAHELRMWALLAVVSIATLSPLWLLSRRASLLATEEDSRVALYYALAFGTLCALAVPIFARDLWYCIAEGRLAASGGNVYTQRLTEAALNELPVAPGARPLTMPYGPGWVWISVVLSRLTAPRVTAEFAAYKAVMFAGWLTMLLVVYGRFARAPALQLRSVVILGWLPFSLISAVAEAHNDIVMVGLMTIWIVRGTATSAWALAASILVKYATAPLTVLAGVDAMARRSTRTLVALAVATAVVLLVLFGYWQDGALVDGLERNLEGSLYTPVAMIEELFHAGLFSVGVATVMKATWRVLLVGLVGLYAWRYRNTSSVTLRAALTTVVFAALLLGAPYIHPHYLLWSLPGLLLSRDRFLMALFGPFILLMPFMQILRVSQIGMSTAFRLTALLHLLLAVYWIAFLTYLARTKAGRQELPVGG